MHTLQTIAGLLALSLVVAKLAVNGSFGAERRLNNLTSELLAATDVASPSGSYTFTRPKPGWVLVTVRHRGAGRVKLALDPSAQGDVLVDREAAAGESDERMRHVTAGEHHLRLECQGQAGVESLSVRAIPELIHCGLGFDSAIKSYGKYDMEFLERDILPNVNTMIVPHNINLADGIGEQWHAQGKRFIAEVGINGQANSAEEHYQHWAEMLLKAPLVDGIIINEFIVNNPSGLTESQLSPDRRERLVREREEYRQYEAALRKLRADGRFRGKSVHCYFGGSGKSLNQEVIGPTFVRGLLDSGCQIALERYLFEVSSEQKSRDVLNLFVEGVADWEAKEPGAKQQMAIAFGLFSMPPGGINKQPNVDYHVWMDQQMNLVANRPELAGLGGLEWWTSILADEETVRFVGKLYRHYALEGKTEMFTRDPLFLAHVQNADFEKGMTAWEFSNAESGSIEARSFPRYGRIEGRYMGLGRPADPEHIGDTFLWMKRSPKGPNTFSQIIRNLQPGRLYSLKMFSCDYQDLVKPQKKTEQEAGKFIGTVTLEGVDVDQQRSFAEAYASNPEPPIPVWITYHWRVFRAKQTSARITVSDWQADQGGTFGQEQTFNFLEIQPYHE